MPSCEPQTISVPALRLSVALVTRNRPASLRRCLESLRQQSAQPFEVVISDDSDSALASVTQRVAEAFDCVYVRGPRRGLYANRNWAARHCRGTHIRTVDDDHTFPPDHFANCLAAVAADPCAVWTTGERSDIDGAPYAVAPRANQLHPSGAGGPVPDPNDNWAIADGSTIYPQTVFTRGLWMVEEFAYGPSYLEFGALLYWCGWRSRCIPGALVEHHADRRTLDRARDRRGVPAQLFASLAYNCCFRPNLLRAFRYAMACLRRDPLNGTLLCRVPRLVRRVRDRWRQARQRLHSVSGNGAEEIELASAVTIPADTGWAVGS